jgi:hypothetical protein
MSLARHCPRRHDGICRATGEHDFRCPETEQAVVSHTTGGQFAKGQSGHKYPLKTLKQFRKRMREEGLDDALFNHLFVLAGVRPDATGVFPGVPHTVQAKVAKLVAEMFWGRKYEVEHTGTVQHEVDVVVSRGVDARVEALTIAEKRALLEAMRPLQRQVEAPTPSADAVDAEFEESPAGGKKEES